MGNLAPLARTYPAGVTSWIEVTQPDVEAAVVFYGGLFGWQLEDVLPPDAPAR
jgi:predicted enzyme related to lactoylglutathione lyase